MNKYKVIAICGKSAAGKDTLLQQIIEQNPSLHEIVSCTTRPPREGEVEGKSYFFLTEEQFIEKTKQRKMLETSKFRDWLYGTSLDGLDLNKINVGVFNPEGIRSLMQDDKVHLYVVLVQASDKVRLMRSLMRESNPNVDEIVRRYLADKADFEVFSSFYEPEYIVDTHGLPSFELEITAKEIVSVATAYWAKETN